MSRAGARSYGEGCAVVGRSANDELDERAEQGELDEEEATCPFDGLHLGLGDLLGEAAVHLVHTGIHGMHFRTELLDLLG